jgi:hypothetical protein
VHVRHYLVICQFGRKDDETHESNAICALVPVVVRNNTDVWSNVIGETQPGAAVPPRTARLAARHC